MNKLKKAVSSQAFNSFLASLISIVVGLAFGFVLLLILKAPAALQGMKAMLTTGFSSPAIIFSSTVLPQRPGPSMTRNSLSYTSRDTSTTASDTSFLTM